MGCSQSPEKTDSQAPAQRVCQHPAAIKMQDEKITDCDALQGMAAAPDSYHSGQPGAMDAGDHPGHEIAW